jgi:hypothetical protein
MRLNVAVHRILSIVTVTFHIRAAAAAAIKASFRCD